MLKMIDLKFKFNGEFCIFICFSDNLVSLEQHEALESGEMENMSLSFNLV